jgi:hypothetical protein
MLTPESSNFVTSWRLPLLQALNSCSWSDFYTSHRRKKKRKTENINKYIDSNLLQTQSKPTRHRPKNSIHTRADTAQIDEPITHGHTRTHYTDSHTLTDEEEALALDFEAEVDNEEADDEDDEIETDVDEKEEVLEGERGEEAEKEAPLPPTIEQT